MGEQSEGTVTADRNAGKPNIIIIFTDDQGYGDLGCFGSENIKTPHIDRMAEEGCRFTSFMVGSSVCTPSRAALLTGCYPKTVGMHKGVLNPESTIGLHPDEYTIADHLKAQGYATACFGKWHLGHHKETLPTRNGFDEYFGIPYSNDQNFPDDTKTFKGEKILWSENIDLLWTNQETSVTHWNSPMIEGEDIIELPTDQRTITRRYTDRAIDFIKRNKEKPFFIYLPHSMPHVPLYVPQDSYDPNPKNAYKCVIEHLDTEVGRLLDTLREQGLDTKTYVIFTSDNGPWIWLGHHAGSAGPLRGCKGETWEGGMRVPCVMWAPGRIPAGTECDQLATTLDLLPTIATLTGSALPEDRKIDGIDLSGLLADPASKSPRSEYLYYNKRGSLECIRQGQWKLRRRPYRLKRGAPKLENPPEYIFTLHDLSEDLSEKNNLADANPELVMKLNQRMEKLDAEVERNARRPWQTDDYSLFTPAAAQSKISARGELRISHVKVPAPKAEREACLDRKSLTVSASHTHTGPFSSYSEGKWFHKQDGSPRDAVDGDLDTFWSTGRPQQNDEWFQIDLGRRRSISRAELENSWCPYDYPREFSVSVSDDGEIWGDPVAKREGTQSISRIGTPHVKTRFIRIKQTGQHPKYWWSISDVRLYP
jgi:arylsulfatase A